MQEVSRRRFMGGVVASLGGIAAPAASTAAGAAVPAEVSRAVPAPQRTLSVVCVGAHPDDPESGCAGTLMRYAAAGHRVTVIYLTRGERGIQGKSLDEAATIRTGEAEAACRIMGAKPVFAGQIDGATEVSRNHVETLSRLIFAEEPDLVFGHWPIDTHMDHQVASLLTFRAYLSAPRRFLLYFYEVNSGSQTLGYMPTAYLDITPYREKKTAALFAHKSQNGEEIYRKHIQVMETYRGREIGTAAAEAFTPLVRDSRNGLLPGL